MARMTGQFGAVYRSDVGANSYGKLLTTTSWEYNAETRLFRADTKGDLERYIDFGVSRKTVTLRRISSGDGAFFAIDHQLNSWRLDLIDNSNTGLQLFGDGWFQSHGFAVGADGAAEEVCSITFDGIVTFSTPF